MSNPMHFIFLTHTFVHRAIMPIFLAEGETNSVVLPGDHMHPSSKTSRKRHRYTWSVNNIYEYRLDESPVSAL